MVPAPTIICPVDFSDHSRIVLRLGAAIARRFAGRLTVLHVNDPLLVAAAATQQMNLAEETEAELRDIVASTLGATDASSARPKILVTMGNPASEILKIARDEEADVIVMGTRGLTGYRKAFFGSTTERVLRHTDLPVLAMPLHGEPGVPEQDPLALRGPILAAIDFSDASTRSARIAAGLAEAFGAPALLVHVVAPLSVPQRWRERVVATPDTDAADVRRQLEDLAGSVRAAAQIETTVVSGAPAEEIARLSSERHAALIAMGLHGAGGLLAPAIGSTTYRVLCLAPVPVLAIPGQPLKSAFFRALEGAHGSNARG